MRRGQVEAQLGYLRFSIESEGEEMGESREDTYSDILSGDVEVAEAIKNYEERKGLSRKDTATTNFYGIEDEEFLDEVDLAFSTIRTAELFLDPIEMDLSVDYLKEIHRRMFSDVYPNAGKFRSVTSSKRSEFASPAQIERLIDDLFWKLENNAFLTKLEEDDDEDFIYELAYVMGELEAIHPFYDGNGRAIRYFITEMAERAGYAIRWDSIDPEQLLEASIASIDGDYQALVDVLDEVTFPIEED